MTSGRSLSLAMAGGHLPAVFLQGSWAEEKKEDEAESWLRRPGGALTEAWRWKGRWGRWFC